MTLLNVRGAAALLEASVGAGEACEALMLLASGGACWASAGFGDGTVDAPVIGAIAASLFEDYVGRARDLCCGEATTMVVDLTRGTLALRSLCDGRCLLVGYVASGPAAAAGAGSGHGGMLLQLENLAARAEGSLNQVGRPSNDSPPPVGASSLEERRRGGGAR